MRAAPVAATHDFTRCTPQLYHLPPPYEQFETVEDAVSLRPARVAPGSVLAVGSADCVPHWDALRNWLPALRSRFPAMPVIVRLPAGGDPALAQCAFRAGELRVRAVLLTGEPVAETLRVALTHPTNLAGDVAEWLTIRQVIPPPQVVRLIADIFRCAPTCNRTGELWTRLRMSKRTLRGLFQRAGMPPPCEWLAVARALRAVLRLQAERTQSLLSIALDTGYSDHSALSRQILRLFDTRPLLVRHTVGWEWFLDRWMRKASPRADTAARHPYVCDGSGHSWPARTSCSGTAGFRLRPAGGNRKTQRVPAAHGRR